MGLLKWNDHKHKQPLVNYKCHPYFFNCVLLNHLERCLYLNSSMPIISMLSGGI